MVTIVYIGFDTYFKSVINKAFYFVRFADASYLVDLYIRMHCQYYNNKGILVTHPWSTMKYYLTTSFALDVITYLPLNYMRLHEVFGKANSTTLKIFFRVFFKPLQLHRLFSWLNYFQSNITNKHAVIIQKFKYSLLILIIFGMSSVLLVTQVCRIGASTGVSVTLDLIIKCSFKY